MIMAEVVPVSKLSEAQVGERLAALAAVGGSPRRAHKRLKSQGIETTEAQLSLLRDEHDGLYLTFAAEMARAQEEAIAQQFRELAIGANRVTAAYVDHMASEIEKGNMPRDVERTVTALTKVAQNSTDKLLALQGRPVNGQVVDPLDSARQLIEMGLLVPVARPVVVDATAEEA